MKKILLGLVAIIAIVTSASAQTVDGVQASWRKDGLYGTGGNLMTGYANFYNSNNYVVEISVEVKAVHWDGEVKNVNRIFRIKAHSNELTSGGYAVIDTRWVRGVDDSKSKINITAVIRL